MKFRQARTLSDWKRIRILYLEAFPKYERKPLGLIWLTQRRGLSHVWCIEEAGVFVGLAITLNVKDMVLLDYLANGMTEMNVLVNLFGTNMELLGDGCKVDFKSYYSVYEKTFGKAIAQNVNEVR